ncbi:MAG: hypothetical protein FD165_2764, partial [Gammaproteobacteria bacterium]
PRRPLLSVAAGAQTLSQKGGKTPVLDLLRFVARRRRLTAFKRTATMCAPHQKANPVSRTKKRKRRATATDF